MVVANLVMENVELRLQSHFETNKVLHWKRFVDDTWCVLPKDKVSSFFDAINDIEPTIKFTMEEEINGVISFLDVKVHRHTDGSFSTGLFHKPTNTNRFLNFTSHHPLSQKRGVVKSLMHRARSIPSSSIERNKEIRNVHVTLRANGYPVHFINKHAHAQNGFVREQNGERTPRKRIPLPYIAGISEKIGRCLRQSNIDVGYKPIRTISKILPRPKDPIESWDKCGVVYNIPCDDCSLTYVGQTKNSLRTRLSQHQAALKHLQTEKSALAEHAVIADHTIAWNKASVLSQERNHRRRLFLETFFSQRNAPVLNRCELFMPSVFMNLTYDQ